MIESELLMGRDSQNKSPILSILIPTYGRADYLYQAIDSAINQDNKDLEYEIIVVSNDPDDSLEGVIERYKDTDNFYLYRNRENIGMVGNSNRCAELARGKYIAYLHDDDYLLPNYIGYVKRAISEKPEIKCFVTGRLVQYENDCDAYRKAVRKQKIRNLYFLPDIGRKKYKYLKIEDSLKISANMYLSPSCGTFMERESFFEVGGFETSILYAWDWDFFLNFNLKYPIIADYEPHAVYRIGVNASMKDSVKYDFFDYQSTKFLEFLEQNNIGTGFLKRYKNELICTTFVQWPEEIKRELESRGLNPPRVNKLKQKWFKFITLLYYYNHNLDFQRPMFRE